MIFYKAINYGLIFKISVVLLLNFFSFASKGEVKTVNFRLAYSDVDNGLFEINKLKINQINKSSTLNFNGGDLSKWVKITGILNDNQGNYSSASDEVHNNFVNSTISVTGLTDFTYSGLPQGPNTSIKTGSTGTVSYIYKGTGSTSYGPSNSPPFSVGT